MIIKLFQLNNIVYLFFSLLVGCSLPSKSPLPKEKIEKARFVTSGKGNSAEDQKTLKIGVLLSLTGKERLSGQEAVKGIRLAFKNLQHKGFFKSKPLEVIEMDSCSQKESAIKAAYQLIDQGVIGIIGDLHSELSMEVAKVCFYRGIPMISLSATCEELTEIGNNIFRVCYTDKFQGALLAQFAYQDCQLNQLGIFIEKDSVYSKSLRLNFEESFKKWGGKVSNKYEYSSNETSFEPALKIMQKNGCQGLLLTGFLKQTQTILRQAKKIGFDVYRLGGDGWDCPELIQQMDPSMIGSFYATHYNLLDERSESQLFVKSWKKNYKTLPLSVISALGYDAALVMGYAIKNLSILNSTQLIEALNNLEKVPGVTGEINFRNKKGNPDKQGVICTLTEKGPIFYQSYLPEDLEYF